MYITRVEIENIRSIKHLVWEIDATNAPGWHVILGDNGSGKSTFVRSVALALIGVLESYQLREDWGDWVNKDRKNDNIIAKLEVDNQEEIDRIMYLHMVKRESLKVNPSIVLNTVDAVNSTNMNVRSGNLQPSYEVVDGYLVEWNWGFTTTSPIIVSEVGRFEEQPRGFHVSYGAFRRFSGGNADEEKLYKTDSLVARHLSVFNEKASLPEGPNWLRQQRFKSLEGDRISTILLENIKRFINQKDFLPFGAQLTEVASYGVKFQDGNGNEINVEEMSDGYRSVLSLTFELLRQLSTAYGPEIFETHEDGKVTVKVPGVVQIDEVDAHLHPTWQKRIGFWFREHFPQMQFIVTTHSPLVCQAAEKGSIFLLPRPGTDETGRMLEGAERDRLVYGDITDAYSTEAFSGGNTRSPAGQDMLERLGELNVKEMLHGLTKAEEQEQERLRLALPSSATELP